jgi:hypothetical protein
MPAPLRGFLHGLIPFDELKQLLVNAVLAHATKSLIQIVAMPVNGHRVQSSGATMIACDTGGIRERIQPIGSRNNGIEQGENHE